MHEFTTPMMKQYEKIKKQYQDCLLFYRMGDFYELFMEDAQIGAKVLDITLTGRPKGKDGRIPMAGVPYHAVDNYLSKLVKAGYKVAICEQVSLPNKNGIIDREVVRIVTPGTVLDEKALEKKENNYIVSILVKEKTLAISAADISTGYFSTMEMTGVDLSQTIQDELSRLHPAECILPPELYNNPDLLKTIKTERGINVYCYQEWDQFAGRAETFLKDHFAVGTLAGFGMNDKLLAQQSAAALLGYLKETQKGTVSHIKKIITAATDTYMQLDRATMINLELFSTIREHDTKGSLYAVLDDTTTAMGGRLLKQWLRKPLIQKEAISERHDAVEKLLHESELREEMKSILLEIADIERILSRLAVGIGNARDLINLRTALQNILHIKETLITIDTPLIQLIQSLISTDVEKVVTIISEHINDEPPIDLRSGGIIKTDIHKELDLLREKVTHSKEWIMELEKAERERTSISSLKVRYNKVFGFYIEISKANLHAIPDNYIRKQTLVNGERFITPELKEQEEIILTAEERIFALEYEIFQSVLKTILSHITALQNAAHAIATLDCLVTFATIAEKNNYIRPKLLYSGEMRISGSRHPVVEKLLPSDIQFVPNDIYLNNNQQQLLLITGPNMAGKSVLIRQTALIVLMNQIGCFVPADQAYLSIVDRIFVRSGASDVITSGLSTFMVEMVETAHILNHATKNSLIVMDEIGRGTSTYDGISIAWAVAEYLVKNKKEAPKTLFATHYHELQALEKDYPKQIKNYHMAVVEEDERPIFLHMLKPGGASSSFGVAVAKLAGIPDIVVDKAKTLLSELEQRSLDHANIPAKRFAHNDDTTVKNENMRHWDPTAPSQTSLIEHIIAKELIAVDIHQMTPLEALNKIADLKDKLRLLQITNEKYFNAD